jgi:hypothetical protein
VNLIIILTMFVITRYDQAAFTPLAKHV